MRLMLHQRYINMHVLVKSVELHNLKSGDTSLPKE